MEKNNPWKEPQTLMLYKRNKSCSQIIEQIRKNLQQRRRKFKKRIKKQKHKRKRKNRYQRQINRDKQIQNGETIRILGRRKKASKMVTLAAQEPFP